MIGIFAIRIRGLGLNNGQNSGSFVVIMGNSPVDKGRGFVESGMKLITERNSDELLKKVEDLRKKGKKCGDSGAKP